MQDPSTGVAPFLVPLPPNDVSLPPLLQAVTLPIAAVLGGVRTLLVILLLGAQFVLVEGVLQLFVRRLPPHRLDHVELTCPPLQSFVPPLHFALSHAVNASIARLILIALGVLWIPVETVQLRKSGCAVPRHRDTGTSSHSLV